MSLIPCVVCRLKTPIVQTTLPPHTKPEIIFQHGDVYSAFDCINDGTTIGSKAKQGIFHELRWINSSCVLHRAVKNSGFRKEPIAIHATHASRSGKTTTVRR